MFSTSANESPRPTRWRRKVGVGLMALATATPFAQMINATAHADLNAITDDTSVIAKTGSWFLSNASEATVNSALASHNARLTNLKVDSVVPMRFTVTMVQNTGAYHVNGWWWDYNMNPGDIPNKMSYRKARLIDIEPYQVGPGGAAKYAAIMVDDTGAAQRDTKWFYETTTSAVNTIVSQGYRPIDLQSYDFGAGRKYAGVAVRNTGADAKAFWYYYNVSASSVASYLSTNKARLVSFQRRSADRYDVVMVAGQGEGWWWYYDQTQASVNALLTANKSRLIDVSRYTVNGSPRFAVVMLQNW
jgi:hypothetical protein